MKLAFSCWPLPRSYLLQIILTSEKSKVSFGKYSFSQIQFLGDKIKLIFSGWNENWSMITSAANSTFAIGVQFVSVWRDYSSWLIRFPKLHLSQNARPSQMCKTLCATEFIVFGDSFSRFISSCWHVTFPNYILVFVLKLWLPKTRFYFALRPFYCSVTVCIACLLLLTLDSFKFALIHVDKKRF